MEPVKRLNFNLMGQELAIQDVFHCLDPRYIVVNFSIDLKYLVVVWDLERNREEINISSEQTPNYFYGPNSRFGYIW